VAAHPHGVVVVAGRAEHDQPALAEALARFAGPPGWPLLADPLSWARRGSAAVAHYDALLRATSFPATAVLRTGDLPTSKPLRAWLAGLDAEQIAFEPQGVWHDPDATLAVVLDADPAATLRDGRGRRRPRLAGARGPRPTRQAAAAIDETLGDGPRRAARRA
jgi:2-succinyl-5-enolpyruvyl-6-hydroxy-3-cyclohexene-1-carboxylate synthase